MINKASLPLTFKLVSSGTQIQFFKLVNLKLIRHNSGAEVKIITKDACQIYHQPRPTLFEFV